MDAFIDLTYYRRRSESERERARIAGEGVARLVHLQLADAYDRLIAAHDAPPAPAA